MKSLLTSFLLVLPIFAAAQCSSSLELSAGFYSTNHRFCSDDKYLEQLLKSADQDVARGNWTAGVSYRTRLRGAFYIKPGLQFASFGYKSIVWSKQVWGEQVVNEKVWRPVTQQELDAISEVQDARNYLFFGIPFIVGAEFGTKKWIPFVEAGVAPSLHVLTTSKQITNTGEASSAEISDQPNFVRLQMVASVSAGMGLVLNHDFEVYAAPTIRYHITSTLDDIYQEYFYGIGIEMGARLGITK